MVLHSMLKKCVLNNSKHVESFHLINFLSCALSLFSKERMGWKLLDKLSFMGTLQYCSSSLQVFVVGLSAALIAQHQGLLQEERATTTFTDFRVSLRLTDQTGHLVFDPGIKV